jgi:hypothetical protein
MVFCRLRSLRMDGGLPDPSATLRSWLKPSCDAFCRCTTLHHPSRLISLSNGHVSVFCECFVLFCKILRDAVIVTWCRSCGPLVSKQTFDPVPNGLLYSILHQHKNTLVAPCSFESGLEMYVLIFTKNILVPHSDIEAPSPIWRAEGCKKRKWLR